MSEDKNSNMFKTIKFALIMCVVASFFITSANLGLKKFQLRNIEIDKQKNIIKSVGLIKNNTSYSNDDIGNLFSKNIKSVWIFPPRGIVKKSTEKTDALNIYIYSKNNTIESYIIPIDTKGLWGKILGYLAIKSDGTTITGFTVYSHSETPGLGGEIERKWFQDNFVGKKIIDDSKKFVSISIAKGLATDSVPENKRENFVDGISGATLTGQLLTKGLKSTLNKYEPVSIRFRQNRMNKLPE